MKKVVIGVVIGVVLYLATTALMGFMVQSRIQKELEVALKMRSPALTIKSQRFDHGLFHSEQAMTVSMMPAQTPGQSFEVIIVNHITHGPICGLNCFGIAKIDTTFTLPAKVQTALDALFKKEPWIVIHSRLDFSGNGSLEAVSPPLAGARYDNFKVSSGGLNLTSSSANNNADVRIDGAAPQLSFTVDDGTRMDLQGATVKGAVHRQTPLTYYGDMEFDVDRVDASGSKPGTSFTANKLQYALKQPVHGDAVDTLVRFDAGETSFQNVTLRAVYLDVTLKDAKIADLEAFSQASRAAPAQRPTTPIEMQRQWAQQYLIPAKNLLKDGASLLIDRIGLDTMSGTIQVKGSIRFSGLSDADFVGDAVLKSVFDKSDIDVDVAIDDAALAELPGGQNQAEQLGKLAAQGLIVHADGKWSTHVHYDRGGVTANGKPFPPPAPPSTPPPPRRR
jgi:uncharacterized protein YdgA (DUF945 family)